jgi:hypothetical protein
MMMVSPAGGSHVSNRNHVVKFANPISVFAGVVVGAGLLLAPAVAAPASGSKRTDRPVQAAPTAYTSTKAPVSTDEPAATSSIATPQLDAGCQKSRRRLWVESEGWVVRRVTTCF